MNLLQQLHKIAHWKLVLILCLTTALLASCLVTMCFGRLNVNPEASLDAMTFYTAETFYQSIEIQGDEGRAAYLRLHLIDYLFITQFYPLFVLIMYMLLHKLSTNRGLALLALLPLFSALMDLLENISIDVSIFLYPARIAVLGQVAGIFTFLKMHSIYLFFGLTVLLAVLLPVKALTKSRG